MIYSKIHGNSYKILNKANILINIDSTLGYEALAKFKKVIFLSKLLLIFWMAKFIQNDVLILFLFNRISF